MKPKSLRQSPILYLVLLALAIITLLWFLNTQKQKSINSLEQQIQVLRADEDRYNEDTLQYQNFQTLLNTWEKTLPKSEEEVAVFATAIESLAKSHSLVLNLDFEDFPGQVDIGGRYATGIGLDISLDGSYQNITTFLHRLDELTYFFKIDKLIITQQELKTGVKASLSGVLVMF